MCTYWKKAAHLLERVFLFTATKKTTELGKEQLSVLSSISVTHVTTSNYTGTRKKIRHIKCR